MGAPRDKSYQKNERVEGIAVKMPACDPSLSENIITFSLHKVENEMVLIKYNARQISDT